MGEKRTVRKELLLTKSEFEAIQDESERTGLTASAVIRLAVREYLKNQNKEKFK
jgi:hypothetical protein